MPLQPFAQTIQVVQGQDAALTGLTASTTDPSAWAFLFALNDQTAASGSTPRFSTTAVTAAQVAGGGWTLTIAITRAQLAAIPVGYYNWYLFRTGTGTNKPLAGGTIQVLQTTQQAP